MTDAIMASLHSYKSLATRKQLQITLEVPSEYAAQALKMLGVGDPSGSQWFAVTRMNVNGPSAREPAGNTTPLATAEVQDKPRNYTRSQRAAIMCQDIEFQKWIGVSGYERGTEEGEQWATANLKSKLYVRSRKELDTDPEAAARFDALRTDFELRDLVR